MPSSAPSRPRGDLIDALLSHPPASARQSGIPAPRPSVRVVPKSLDELAADLSVALRPPAKVSPARSRRRALNEGALCRYRAMVDYVRARGWSWRKIAREAECTVEHVQACYEGHRNVPGWLLEAFPADAQTEAVRLHIEQLRKVR